MASNKLQRLQVEPNLPPAVQQNDTSGVRGFLQRTASIWICVLYLSISGACDGDGALVAPDWCHHNILLCCPTMHRVTYIGQQALASGPAFSLSHNCCNVGHV